MSEVYDDADSMVIVNESIQAPYTTMLKELAETLLLLDARADLSEKVYQLLDKELDLQLSLQADVVREHEATKKQGSLKATVVPLRGDVQ